MNTLRRILTHPLLALIFRLYIGGLFVYAAMYKINYAAEFAETIASYRLVPYYLVDFLAVFMPWLELVCGGLMIAGFRTRAAAGIVAALITVFTVAIIVNLLRGSNISCGCFHTIEDPISWWTVLRDLTWLAMTIHVYFFDSWLRLEQRFFNAFKDMRV